MADFPCMPFWTDAYLADTRHLTTEEHGAYLLLLMTAWRTKDGTLPEDDKLLSRYAGLSMRKWLNMKTTILEFFDAENGVLLQKKLQKEKKFLHDKKQKASFAGKASALKRKETAPTDVEFKLQQKRNSKPTTHTHTHTTNKKYIKKDKNMFEEFWKVCPRKVGKGKAEEKYKLALQEISHNDIVKAMKAHASQVKDSEKQYIPHPATWLHQKRYFDEVEPFHEDVKEDWPDWKCLLAARIGESNIKSWFHGVKLNGKTLTAPKAFQADKIRREYMIDIEAVMGRTYEVTTEQ